MLVFYVTAISNAGSSRPVLVITSQHLLSDLSLWGEYEILENVVKQMICLLVYVIHLQQFESVLFLFLFCFALAIFMKILQ